MSNGLAALSEREAGVMQYILDYHDKKGYAPTVREIGKECKLSLGGVTQMMQRLQAKGWVEKERYKSRAMKLFDPRKATAAP